MVELGQLEEHQVDFASRHVKVVAVSSDSVAETAAMQKQFPHLLLISDASQQLAVAAQVLGPHHSPEGQITNAPTTLFINKSGQVQWVYRPQRYIERLPAPEALAKVDEFLRTP